MRKSLNHLFITLLLLGALGAAITPAFHVWLSVTTVVRNLPFNY
jgi:hypothetical protein